jgi:hypothetical protein
MIREAEELKNKLDVTVINKDQLNKILLERINFAFDSLYFRYAMAIKELGEYKEKEALREGRNFSRKHWEDGQCMHFYKVLEEILEAHAEDHPLRSNRK